MLLILRLKNPINDNHAKKGKRFDGEILNLLSLIIVDRDVILK